MKENERNGPWDRGGDGSVSVHVDPDVCVDLLHGLLDPAMERQVLIHLTACPTCESLLKECVAGRERLRATRTIQRLPSGEIVIGRAGNPETFDPAFDHASRLGPLGQVLAGLRRPPTQSWRAFAGALATVAAVLLVAYWVGPRSVTGPFPVTPLPVSFDAPHLLACKPSAEDPRLHDGLSAYAVGDYARASEYLAGARGPAGESRATAPGGAAMGGGGCGEAELENYRLVYLGSALALSGRYRAAASVLRPVMRRVIPDPWGSNAAWTLHESLRRSGQEQSADSLLRVLAGELGPDGDRARSMLAGEPPARK
jgi:hypothetical protein